MIRYALTCAEEHRFESWFQSAVAFGTLQASGHLSCPFCGSTDVSKALMAPAVRPARKDGSAQQGPLPDAAVPAHRKMPGAPPARAASAGALTTPANDREQALAALRREIEKNSDYVGMNFAQEARRIHDGDAPERPIYGEARPEEARRLIEDGIPVAPLPFRPLRKAN